MAPPAPIYELSTDPDLFARFAIRKDDRDKLHRLFRLEPVSDSWFGLPVELDTSASNELGDFPCLDAGNVSVFSQKAVDAMQPLMEGAVEILKLGTYSGTDFLIVHVIAEVDVLDRTKSKISRLDDGTIVGVKRFVFRPEQLVGKHIFQIPERRFLNPLVSEAFKTRVLKQGLKGTASLLYRRTILDNQCGRQRRAKAPVRS